MASFASTARTTGFQSLGLARADRSAGLQPLPMATSLGQRGVAGRVRSIGSGLGAADEEPVPQGPPPPTREELQQALAAQADAEQSLRTAQRELAALREALEAEQRASRDLAGALDQAFDATQAEMRGAYAELVLTGCRRLLGSLGTSQAVFHAQLDTVSEQLVLESDVVLRVSPANKRTAEAAIFGRMGWSVEVDPTMDGGCIALCRNSLVDARLETAFDGMDQALRAWLAQDGPGVQSK